MSKEETEILQPTRFPTGVDIKKLGSAIVTGGKVFIGGDEVTNEILTFQEQGQGLVPKLKGWVAGISRRNTSPVEEAAGNTIENAIEGITAKPVIGTHRTIAQIAATPEVKEAANSFKYAVNLPTGTTRTHTEAASATLSKGQQAGR
jgi:hypothetical protein